MVEPIPHRLASSRKIARKIARTIATILILACVTTGRADDARPYTTWSEYGGSADSMQYSALAQINRGNVKQLQPAWFYPVSGDPDRLPFNPLVVDDVMYVAGGRQPSARPSVA
jgi:quinoprotein glucose dehydrogenase